MAELARARRGAERGLSLAELASLTVTDPLQVEPVVESLQALDWVARLDDDAGQRLVLLIDPDATGAQSLIDTMLLEPHAAVRRFRERAGFERLMLGELLAPAPA